MIPVNKPFLPPKSKYEALLSQIWDSQWLTNHGPILRELEDKIRERISHPYLHYVSNGTIALQLAIKTLSQPGEIITTPFSFVATTSSIVWENFKPVFCDIEESSLNIDATKIESLITNNTRAILATHVYGNPCEVAEIHEIAKKYNLVVIYDAAHAFDVELYDRSVFTYGNISTCSLHATKYYHSIEGGLVVSNNESLHSQMAYMRSFGFNSNYDFHGLGINAKNSEFHAAMGLINLEYLESIKEKRKDLSSIYDESIDLLPIRKPEWHKHATKNYAYYPIIFEDEETLLFVQSELENNDINTRRYFYPSLNTALPYVDSSYDTPICESLSKRVLCLPLYYDLKFEDADKICKVLTGAMSYSYI